ncbi:MAG TPA: alpha-amylase family glycosyl hydrolase [Coriobacteriia bacterium]|jgi:alpha-glucosidase
MDVPDGYRWWQAGVIYQVYPRSFQDSDGDGVGDLRGIVRRLDYLEWLGVDAVWICPVYPSPMADFGYDISDYCAIDPLFGTMEDFDRVVAEAHGRGMRVLLDYVPNHTSDHHPWFVESRSGRDSPKRDWYIWRDPGPDGGAPNNWLAHFGGSAWTYDGRTRQYYYHGFLPQQPDLDWRNPEVREAMLDVLRFWLSRGVDGFRVDVLWHIVKDAEFRDDPPNPDYVPDDGPYNALAHVYSTDRPEVHDIVRRMREVLDGDADERLLIGEIYLPVERLIAYYGENCCGAQLPFNFQLIELPWNAERIKRAVDGYEALLPLGGWPNWVIGNHDHHRIVSRVGYAQARIAAMMLLTLRGTPTLYYGDEIGMTDVPIRHERIQDPYEKRVPGLGLGRDPERTPMQWDDSANAGFTAGTPWLPLADDSAVTNVEAQREEELSMLSLYRRLIELRRAEPALSVGPYTPLPGAGDVFAYGRRDGPRRFLVALNLGHHDQVYPLAPYEGVVILSTLLDREAEPVRGALALRPNEGVVIAVV